MWTELENEEELAAFIRLVCGFHDSVLKEFSYVSGAYVDDNLNMYPMDDKACLRMLIQRQDETLSALELEFSGLQELRRFQRETLKTRLIQEPLRALWRYENL